MKTEVPRPFASFWQAISEVPGWPDAPLRLRLRRMWPLVIPVVACAALAAWTWGMREPHRDEVRARHVGVLALEEEVAQLQQACSDQVAAELAAQADAARERLLGSPDDIQARLDLIVSRARSSGWKATAQVYGGSEVDAEAASRAVTYIPARLRLEPRAGNPNAFNALMALLRSIVADEARFEITLLAIRAEQPGVLVTEVNLRAACRPAP